MDTHRGLGLPLCGEDVLCDAILKELCKSSALDTVREPWKLFASKSKPKENMRTRAGEAMKASENSLELSGEFFKSTSLKFFT